MHAATATNAPAYRSVVGVAPASVDLLNRKAEAAMQLGVSIATVERHIRAGRLRAVKLGALTRIRQSEIDIFLAALPPAEYRQAATGR